MNDRQTDRQTNTTTTVTLAAHARRGLIMCIYIVAVEVSVMLESENTAVFLIVRVNKGGCGVASVTGVFPWLYSNRFYNITSDLAIL